MSRRLFGLLVVFVPLALLGGLWLSLGDPGWSSEPTSLLPGEEAQGPGAPQEPIGSVVPSPLATGPVEHERADSPERQAAVPEPLADALWVEGRLVLPDGLPLDEVVWLEGRGKRFGKGPDAARSYRTAAERDGSFRIAFAPKTREGSIRLEARYLYLEGAVDCRPLESPESLVVTPRVGGRIVGRVTPPPGTVVGARTFARTVVHGWTAGSSGRVARQSAVAADGSFELNGLPSGPSCRVSLQSEDFVDLQLEDIAVSPLETTEVNLDPRPGARVAGIVVDALGAPLAGIPVRLFTRSEDAASADYAGYGVPQEKGRVHSSSAGTFLFSGLAPRKASLSIDADGFERLSMELGALREGELLGGVEARLSRGWSIRGVVVWPDGAPVSEAKIRAREQSLAQGFTGRRQDVKSGTDGTFLVRGLAADSAQVSASAPREVTWPGGSAEQTWSTDWIVAAADEAVVRLTLAPGNTLRGQVVNSAGKPVRRFRVTAERDSGASGGGDNTETSKRFMSDQGIFELSGLDPGVWLLTAEARGYHLRTPVRAEVPTVAVAQLVMLPSASVRGVVFTPSGERPEGVKVYVSGQPDSSFEMESRTDRVCDKGAFHVDDISARSITIHATAPGWSSSVPLELSLQPGEERTGLVLTLRESGRVEGEVNRQLLRVAGRSIEITGTISGQKYATTVQSDASGYFSLAGLAEGRYRAELIRLEDEDHSPLDQGAAFKVRSGETTRVVVGCPPLPSIRVHGRVTHRGEPVVGCEVRIDYRDESVITDADGRYQQTVNQPGWLHVWLDPPAGRQLRLSRQVGPEADQQLDFALPSACLSGTIHAASGRPASGARVVLKRIAGEEPRWRPTSYDERADEQGCFQFEHLQAGGYALTVPAGFPAQAAQHAHFELEGLELAEGEHLEDVTVSLRLAASLAGTVTRADGTPVVGARISLRDGEGNNVRSAATRTNRYGQFEVDLVPVGTIDVSAQRGGVETLPARVILSAGERAAVDLRFR